MNRTFLLLTMGLLGCSGATSPVDRPDTHPVSGTVKLDGAPLAGASVTFKPTQREGRGAFAKTDDQGVYKLRTFDTADGAMLGRYGVTIQKREVIPGDPSYNDSDSENYGKEPPPEAAGKTIEHVAAKYANTRTSGLSADVKEGENTFSFDLTN